MVVIKDRAKTISNNEALFSSQTETVEHPFNNIAR